MLYEYFAITLLKLLKLKCMSRADTQVMLKIAKTTILSSDGQTMTSTDADCNDPSPDKIAKTMTLSPDRQATTIIDCNDPSPDKMADKSPFKIPPPADSTLKQCRDKQILISYMLLDPTTSKAEIYATHRDIALETVVHLNRSSRLVKAKEKQNVLLRKQLEEVEEVAKLKEQPSHQHSGPASEPTDEDFLTIVEPVSQEDDENDED
ncbi:uncharacterized protein V6R79_019355 [Siganus canaliculatus]